ncbi:hypothetical protein [Solicola sp. PLA-1-18]|uniref:DoxX family protein n=1 Tax=Solicola sp. PLA-1-18 TaxID=3380532 RepID=UPI003B7E95D6
MPTTTSLDVKALTAILAVAGVGHLARPAIFEPMIPRGLPGSPRTVVHASGVAELACAAALLHPRTRRVGGYATAALMAGVFPGNVQMAVTAHRSTRATRTWRLGTLARLPLQVPLITTALKAARQGE